MHPHYPTAYKKELQAKHLIDTVPEFRIADRENPVGFVSSFRNLSSLQNNWHVLHNNWHNSI
jgi:hypothetical protein